MFPSTRRSSVTSLTISGATSGSSMRKRRPCAASPPDVLSASSRSRRAALMRSGVTCRSSFSASVSWRCATISSISRLVSACNCWGTPFRPGPERRTMRSAAARTAVAVFRTSWKKIVSSERRRFSCEISVRTNWTQSCPSKHSGAACTRRSSDSWLQRRVMRHSWTASLAVGGPGSRPGQPRTSGRTRTYRNPIPRLRSERSRAPRRGAGREPRGPRS